MRLSCLKAVLLVSLITIACRDSTAPTSNSGRFFLASANGQSLPATLYSSPLETSIVISAEIDLTPDGKAALTELRRNTYQGTITESTFKAALKYRVSGANITIGSFTPCGPDANCIGDFVGKIDGTTLMLAIGFVPPNNTPLIYSYERGDPPFAQ